MLCAIIVAGLDDSDGEPEAEDNGENAAADISITNTQQESSHEYEASRELVMDQTISSTDYASRQSNLVKGSTTSLNVTATVDETTRHCVVSNNGNSMAIVEDATVCSCVVAITNDYKTINGYR